MDVKNKTGSTKWVDPDDAPTLTKEFFAEAEIFDGSSFVRRGPGRPKSANAKEAVNIRLDPDVLAALRQSGPGWQSRVNLILRAAPALNAILSG